MAILKENFAGCKSGRGDWINVQGIKKSILHKTMAKWLEHLLFDHVTQV